MTKASSGFTAILIATVIAGVAGYLITFLVFRMIGPADYAVFAVFWASLYLLVGGLGGIQQEITRATHPIELGSRERASRARTFAVLAALVVAALVVGTAPLWQASVFPDSGWALVLPLAVGAGSYVLVATLSGSLYGVAQWRSLALMIAADGVLRLLFIVIGLLVTPDVVALAWAAAVPFPLAIMVLWPIIRGTFVGLSDLDVGYGALTWNVARTVLASVSSAVLVSGFPLLLGLAGRDSDATLRGELIFTITLARAPLIVTVLSLQSVLLVRFRDHPANWLRVFLMVQAFIVAAAVLVGIGGLFLGPAVFEFVGGSPITLSGQFIAILVGSSAFVGGLYVSGSAVLARSQHLVYSAGWVTAAAVTIVVMLLNLDLQTRVATALVVGPIAGLLVHLTWLVAASLRARRATA
ncbi:MAG: hypothetical protein ABJB03_00220 [Rhodoglobus sp.]